VWLGGLFPVVAALADAPAIEGDGKDTAEEGDELGGSDRLDVLLNEQLVGVDKNLAHARWLH
jgi:hypothetical protein